MIVEQSRLTFIHFLFPCVYLIQLHSHSFDTILVLSLQICNQGSITFLQFIIHLLEYHAANTENVIYI